MASAAAEGDAADVAATPVPDDDDLQEPPDPWRDYVAGRTEQSTPPPGFSPPRGRRPAVGQDDLAGFEEFLRRRGAVGRRAGRRADDDDDEGEEEAGGTRSNAGPPPQWDGTTAFRDYEIRARLWLATTKVKAKARGPSLLRNLSGTPFDDLKHLAKDVTWMQSEDNGERLIKLMSTKELYGEDEREEMINTLVKVTYTLRRTKNEGYKAFFARWDNAVRKLSEHKVDLPQEYLGFLLVMALQVTPDEVKLMMNYTQGKLTQKAVKEWIRVQEADLAWNAPGQKTKKVESIMLMDDASESYVDTLDGDEPEDENLEILMNALGDLEGDLPDDEASVSTAEVFDEDEAKEVLATMVKEHSKGGFRRSFKAVNDAKRAKGLARGYGTQRDPNGRFGTGKEPGKNHEIMRTGQSYRVSIEALKKKTRCAKCKQIGHWHRECPNPAKPKDAHYLEAGSEEVLFLHYLDFLDSKKEKRPSTASSSSSTTVFPRAVLNHHATGAGREHDASAYMCSALGLPHELLYMHDSVQADEDACATIDTGCQRTAVGKETLDRMIARYPPEVQACYRPEEHVFKSVNGLSRTKKVACIPASLGPGGCILRPAVFEEGQTSKAPFLISLPFLLFCRAQLDLDPQRGLRLKLRKFNHEVPLHIGPTGALRVPLDQFSPEMLNRLSSALGDLRSTACEANLLSETELQPEVEGTAGQQVRPNDPAASGSPPRGPSEISAASCQAYQDADRGGGGLPPPVPLAPNGTTHLHRGSELDLPHGGGPPGLADRPPRTSRADGRDLAWHDDCRAGGSPDDGGERDPDGQPPGGRMVGGGTRNSRKSSEATDGGEQPYHVLGRVRPARGDPVLLPPRDSAAENQEAGPESPPAVLEVPPLLRRREPMRVFPVGERREPRHVAAYPEEWSSTTGPGQCEISRTFLTELERGKELNGSTFVTRAKQPTRERPDPRRPGGEPMWMCQSSPGGHWVQCLGDPDQMRPLRQGDAAQGDSHGKGPLREDQPGAANSQDLASDTKVAKRRVRFAEANSEPRDTTIEAPVPGTEPCQQFERGTAESDADVFFQRLEPEEQHPERTRNSGRHGAGVQRRDLCRVPGVQEVHGGQKSLPVRQQQPEVKLSVNSQRHLISSLQRAEQVWNGLQDCLANGAGHLCELKDRATKDYRKGLSKQRRQVYTEIFNLSNHEFTKMVSGSKPKDKIPPLNLEQCVTINLGRSLVATDAQQSVLTYLKHVRPGLVIIRQPGPSWFSRERMLGHFKQCDTNILKQHITKQKEYRQLLQFSVRVCQACDKAGAAFVLEEPCRSSERQDHELRALKKIGTLWTAKVAGWRDGDDLERDGGRDGHDLGRDGGRDGHDLGRDGGRDGRYPSKHLAPRSSVVTNMASMSSRMEQSPNRPGSFGTQLATRAYANMIHRRWEDIKSVTHEEIIAEDNQHDTFYFTVPEQKELRNHEMEREVNIEEILHQEDEVLEEIEVLPGNYGINEQMVGKGGKHILNDGTVAVVLHEADQLPAPEPTEEHGSFPWRSSWTRGEDGKWRCLEDEVRWQELPAEGRPLLTKSDAVMIYRKRLDGRKEKRSNHFPGMGQVTLQRMVMRAHEGLGHPEPGRFLRILRHSKVSPEAIEIAKNLRCSVCEAYKVPAPIRQGAPPREDLFINDLVGVDTVHLRNHKNQTVPALNMIDWHSHFQLVVPMAAETAAETRSAYRQWVRFFGPPRKLMIDLGGEFKAEFRKQAEADGSEIVPGTLETPTQRGLTERAGGIFKDILYKAMATYGCEDLREWKELVDVTCMTRNRLLLRAGYSPIQRVIGYSPRIPGGLLQGGDQDEMVAELQHVGDTDANRAMRMRKAAATAFHEADCDQALRAATLAGRRQHQNIEVGQAIYFWRRGAGTHKKMRNTYWQGPGRVVMTSLPNAVWIAYQGGLVKAAPERTRPATEEEALSLSGWMRGISQARAAFERNPKRNFVDLTKDTDLIEDETEHDGEAEEKDAEVPEQDPPAKRVRSKTNTYARAEPSQPAAVMEGGVGDVLEELREGMDVEPTVEPDGDGDVVLEAPPGFEEPRDAKRSMEDAEQPRGKRSRVELLEAFHMNLTTLAKQRQKKEAKVKDFVGKDRDRLDRAILKEVNNNLETGAYKILSLPESYEVLRNKPEKVMESRYVLTKKPLEPSDVAKAQMEGLVLDDQQHGPAKAKCRHVMKGFSEEAALDVESTTPQVSRDSVIFVNQVLASMRWCPGFLDFTQAFHSGDKINRELYCRQPSEGIPGMHKDQILMLLKTCYGLTDGPYAWYQHLCRRLREMEYQTSLSDPCVFFLHRQGHQKDDNQLEGIIGLATDDMLHGGTQRHWENIQKIAEEYKLGKNQKGTGRFTGKDISLQPDGSIIIEQEFYVREKAEKINIPRKRKQQRFSRCTAEEVEQLRSQLGVLSWLAKETRCDLAGRVCLLQQCFPEPKVADLLECNKIIEEAMQHSSLGIRVMPIDWRDLRVSVVTDAAWGNSKEKLWIENPEEDFWEETEKEWIRYHKAPRRTSFHPGAAQGGPDLHQISAYRRTEMFVNQDQAGIKTRVSEDTWNNDQGIRVLNEETWCGRTRFRKCSSEEPAVQKIHSSLQQLQNLSSQGGQIILYHDKALAEGGMETQATLAAWKSFRLKRKTVDTLAAEGQALQSGIGSIHWHRLLFLEAFYGMLSTARWREESRKIPFLAAVDSKSLYDAANKCTSTTAYISDKRTAIDLAVIKADLLETSGTIRWIDTRAMIADPLTKAHPATYLRYVMSVGKWSIVEEGTALQRKALERGERKMHHEMYLFWEHKV